MAKKVSTPDAPESREPSAIELAQVFQESLDEFKRELRENQEAAELQFDDKISMLNMEVQEKLAKDAKATEVDNFIRSSKIAGELDRVEIFKLTFSSVLQGLLGNPTSALFKMTNTEAGRQNREHEVKKLFEIADLVSAGLENYFEV